MKTCRTILWVLVVTVVSCIGIASQAQGQQAVYIPSGPSLQGVRYPSDQIVYQMYYQRIYQGTSWYWSPALGWHTHARYIDAPYWAPAAYVNPQPLSVPIFTTRYAR